MAYVNSKKYGSNVQHYKKANGDISYSITYKDSNNKLKRVKIGEKSAGITEAYCFQKRNEIINKIRLGDDIPVKHRKKKRFTFQDAFYQYIEWAKGNKKSWEKDEHLFTAHLLKLHKEELTSLKPKDFEALKQVKLKTHSVRTVEYILAVARQIINFAIREELVKNYANPISGGRVKIPKPDNAKVAFLSYEQARELLDKLKARDSQTLYNMTVLLLFTGGRFIEVASLTWNDINFKNNLIHFKATKNGNPRHVVIVDEVREVLQSLPRDNLLVLPAANGKQMERMPRQWQLLVDKMIPGNVEAEKHRITVHSLRHTHASWMALEGADILQIKEQLGHKKLDMTLRYAHLIPSRRHEVIERILSHYRVLDEESETI